MTVSMTEAFSDFTADKAVDFQEDTNPNICNCCASSVSDPAKWFLNLGKQYAVNKLIFIGRSDACKLFLLSICEIVK